MDITVEELRQRLKSGEKFVFVDVREPWEYEELLRELIQRGYDNLRVVSKGRIAQA